MIRSMTGFGEAQFQEEGHAYHVEIRGVNHRYFKPTIHLPEEVAFLESELEQTLRQRITRGSVIVRLDIRDLSDAAAEDINLAALQHYLAQLKTVMSGDARYTVDLATLATLPGVCQPQSVSEHEREAVSGRVGKLVHQALDMLLAMRATEGKGLADDLRKQCSVIRENVEKIRGRIGAVIREYRDRLAARIQELIANSNIRLAEETLAREVAVYAERSDISEEIQRMESHLKQFATAMDSTEVVGRKLDFIAQEMLREANTMGSKSGDSEISYATIEIKQAVDRIKEQVQNVE